MNWSTALREADASADAHLCSVPSRGAIKAVPDQHWWLASSKLSLRKSQRLFSVRLYARRSKMYSRTISLRIYRSAISHLTLHVDKIILNEHYIVYCLTCLNSLYLY